jgi:hypothetical protein
VLECQPGDLFEYTQDQIFGYVVSTHKKAAHLNGERLELFKRQGV